MKQQLRIHSKSYRYKKECRNRAFEAQLRDGSQRLKRLDYRLVTLMTISTIPAKIHLSGTSSRNSCAIMSFEISEVIVSCIAISI